MQSHDFAKYLRIFANLVLMNAKQEKLAQMFDHVSAQKKLSEHFDCANKVVFRMSAGGVIGPSL